MPHHFTSYLLIIQRADIPSPLFSTLNGHSATLSATITISPAITRKLMIQRLSLLLPITLGKFLVEFFIIIRKQSLFVNQ